MINCIFSPKFKSSIQNVAKLVITQIFFSPVKNSPAAAISQPYIFFFEGTIHIAYRSEGYFYSFFVFICVQVIAVKNVKVIHEIVVEKLAFEIATRIMDALQNSKFNIIGKDKKCGFLNEGDIIYIV